MIAKLQNYLDHIFLNKLNHSYIETCEGFGRKIVDEKINKLLTHSAIDTGTTEIELLNALDFDGRNYDEQKIQSVFAVLRTIRILSTELFFNKIKPLPRQPGRKEADLLAFKNNLLFSIEVARSSEIAPRWVGANLNRYISDLWGKKEEQIRSSMSHHKCEKGMLCIILDSEPAKSDLCLEVIPPFPKWLSLPVIIEGAYRNIGDPKDIHLLLSTGQFESGEKLIYAVFPRLDT